MRFLATVFAVSSMLLMSACGSDESLTTPSTPTAPSTPTVSSLTINGLDAIRTGFFSDYTATASLSNGTSQAVTPSWSSSNTGVATVDANGRLSGLSHGSMALAASYQGMNASKNVSVVSNFGGSWVGTYVIRACDQAGVFASARWCQGLGGVGSILPVTLTLSQTGSDRTQVTGSLALGDGVAGNISGNVTGDGRLILGGSFTVTSSGVTFQFVFGGWETQLVSPGQMRGRWAQSQTAIGVTGNAYQEVEIVTMTQTSTTAVPIPAPSQYTMTWQEFFSRIR